MGYAHALGKSTILLTQNADDIPFDLKHFPHIVYGTKITTLRNELEKRIRFFIENPPGKDSDMKLGLELFISEQNLASGNTIFKFHPGLYPSPTITVFNASSDTLTNKDFKVGLFYKCENEDVRTIKLPDGSYLYGLPDFPSLFPDDYASFTPSLKYSVKNSMKEDDKEMITVRLFTRQGKRDYPVCLVSERPTS